MSKCCNEWEISDWMKRGFRYCPICGEAFSKIEEIIEKLEYRWRGFQCILINNLEKEAEFKIILDDVRMLLNTQEKILNIGENDVKEP